VFYEPIEDSADVVRRVVRDDEGMHPKLLTVSELMLTCGAKLPGAADRTSAQQELALEERFRASICSAFEESSRLRQMRPMYIRCDPKATPRMRTYGKRLLSP